MTTKNNDPNITNAAGETVDLKVLNVAGDLDDVSRVDEILGVGDQTAGPDYGDGLVSKEMAGTILATPFTVAAAYLGGHWKLSKEELDLMSPPAARLFSQWFGRWCGKYPDAYMLGFALCVAIGPRAAITISERNKAQEKSKAIAPGTSAVPVPDMNNETQNNGYSGSAGYIPPDGTGY